MAEQPFTPLPQEDRLVARGPEDHFPMPLRQWNLLIERVRGLANPVPHTDGLMWACVGVFFSAALTLFPWLAAYKQLPEEAKLDFAWITPVIIITGIASVIIGGYVYFIKNGVKEFLARNASQVVEDMEEIARPFRRHQTQERVPEANKPR